MVICLNSLRMPTSQSAIQYMESIYERKHRVHLFFLLTKIKCNKNARRSIQNESAWMMYDFFGVSKINMYICRKQRRIHALPLPSRRYSFLIWFLSFYICLARNSLGIKRTAPELFPLQIQRHSFSFFNGFNMVFSFTFFSLSLLLFPSFPHAFDRSFRYRWFTFFQFL